MKLKISLLFIAVSFSFGIHAQVADSVYYERLYYTCKVWGHAKYYHSRIAAGEVNWDNVLLCALPGIKNAPNNLAFNDSLLLMLQQAGETEAGTETLPEVPDSLNNNTDLSWMYHPIFSNQVSALLDTIMQRFTPRSNIYVESNFNTPGFINDSLYYSGYSSEIQYPDESKRILAVFRYWNIIHYFFPYKHIMDTDWDAVLVQTIPTIVTASNALEYHLGMRMFTAKINDSHAEFMSLTYDNWEGIRHTPFLARLIEGKVVVTKVHSSAPKLSPGDIITKIDGYDIDYLRDSLRKYSYGSNEVWLENRLINIILWGDIGQFSLSVLNGTGEHTFNLNRIFASALSADTTPAWRIVELNGCHFGIVNMGKLTYNHFPQIIDNFQSVDAIIFDIRNYPNGTLWPFANYLFDAPIHIANFRCPSITYPGMLFWEEEMIGQGNPDPLRKQVMILFDERTISQAEYTCMGLEQIPNAIKIGSTTAAADGNTSCINLPGGISTWATFLGTYYPDYTPTQRVGIIPDYVVRPTIQGIRENRDEVLEFALNCKWLKINDYSKNDEIIIYPNPTTGKLQVITNNLQVTSVEVWDMFGKKQKETIDIVLDITNLPQGVYIAKIMTNGGIFTRKILKIN